MSNVNKKDTGKRSSNFRFFTWVVLFFSIAQLLIGLDYIGIWPGAEAAQVEEAVLGNATLPIQLALLNLMHEDAALWLFFYRLPGLICYVGALGLFFLWAKPLFGKQTVLLTILVVACSFFLPIMAKLSTGDIYQFSFVLLFWVSTLRWQKSTDKKWLLVSSIAGIFALLLGLSFIVVVVFALAFFWLFKDTWKTNWQKALPFLILILIGILLFIGFGENRAVEYFVYAEKSQFKGILYAFLGLSPMLGFVIAGLRDLWFKWKKKEEFSRIIALFLLISLFFSPLLFSFLLALIAAKQMIHYFDSPNYPWGDWVRGVAVLHLISVFIIVVLVLIGGYVNFKADGFRAALGCSAAYWMFSFIAVIGLYGPKRDYVWGGICLSGVVALLFFWMQVYPFAHLQRNWPEQITSIIVVTKPIPTEVQIAPDAELLIPHLLREGINVTVVSNDKISSPNESNIFIAPVSDSLSMRQNGWESTKTISGWSGLLKEEHFGIYLPVRDGD